MQYFKSPIMKGIKLIIPILILISSISCNESKQGHFITDKDFILLKDSISPNGKFVYYEYQFDNGGHGYSRVFWSLTQISKNQKNLLQGKIPDGYRIKGWSRANELILEKWTPYYYKEEEIELKTGSELNGIRISLINE